ncbi:MAG: hypothetical protein RL444_372 [Verrucomicrobiota bacterium]|jgi:hypothetical protein
MTPRELRIISALAVFLTAGLPAAAGAIAFRSQPVLVATIIGEPGQLPGLTGLFFNHFSGALIGLLVIGLGVTSYAVLARLREQDDVVRMTKLLAATCFSALISVAFLALFVLAAALPAYAKLMQR